MPDRATQADINLRAVVLAALAILVMICIALLVAYWMWSHLRPAPTEGGPNAPYNFKVAAPRLESAPQTERNNYFSEKERLLHSWQWVDKKAGIARIPIDVSMQLMAQSSASSAGNARSRQEKKR
jgi:hypothetical protein